MATKRKTRVGGTYPAICTECYQTIDMVWLEREKAAKRFPIVHECGRVLLLWA